MGRGGDASFGPDCSSPVFMTLNARQQGIYGSIHGEPANLILSLSGQ
jgi:hypothetical protein